MWNDKAIAIDWRGVPRVIYDEAGKEVWRGEFGPFGEPLYERGIVSNYIPFRLYGMYKDMETGLYYNVRRYYDWRVGRYLQPDPVSDLNLYVYVNNSPYDLVDPVGMFQTTMRVTKTVWVPPTDSWHEGHAIHERITENAINEASWCFTTDGARRSICCHKDRVENWDMEPEVCFAYDQFCLRCRTYANRVAQGANRADCLYATKSYFHCDNSNFAGCYDIAWQLSRPAIYYLINRRCVDIGPIIITLIRHGTETGGGGTGGGGRGCSVIPRLQRRSFNLCSCSFGTFSVWLRAKIPGFPSEGRTPSTDIPQASGADGL
ncbi:MAG: RHS repeat domain-containing protein [Candidatus Calescibacterium sp.]